MSIIHDIPAEVTTLAVEREALQLDRYQAGLALAAKLMASTPTVPNHITVQCRRWAPSEVTVQAYAHQDLNAVQAWHTHFGGELVAAPNGHNQVRWSASTMIDGIAVELWTLLDAEPEPLPVRERYTEAEQQLTDRWVARHGDRANWRAETRLAYANTLANMRAGGAL